MSVIRLIFISFTKGTCGSRIKENRCENVIPLNIGISDSEKEATLNFKNDIFTVKLTTLHQVLKELSIERTDFVKMDVEGFERNIVEASQDVINNTSFVSMELHGDQSLLFSLMKSNGFDYFPLSQGELRNKLMHFVFTHPIFSTIAYMRIFHMEGYGLRQIMERIDGGFHMIDEGKLSVGLFCRAGRVDST